MPDGMTFKENIENEKRKWGQMDGPQRWEYFKDYYLLPLAVTVGVIALVIYLLLQWLVFQKEVVMSGTVYNLELTGAGISEFEEGFLSYLGGDPKKQEARIGSSYISKENYNEIMVVQAKVGSETLDFMILDQDAYELLNEQSFYQNLDDILAPELLEKLGDKLETIEDLDTGITYNSALDISDTEFAKNFRNEDKAYLVFVAGSHHLEDAGQLVEYLFKK